MAATIPVAQAQDEAVSREVVQGVPSAEVAALNDALRRLASNGRDLRALIDAGNAALQLGDDEAAISFFGRAEEVSPTNADAKLGLAAVFMRSERPVEALRYFTAAEMAGASSGMLTSDRGLAHDLVGQHALAQESYRAALAQGEDDETIRRLALSHAIVGERAEFDRVLRPLLMTRDVAAYRTRAFGLAILGDMNEARGLVTTVIPRDLASRIIPYLEFMPRLTGAQQAAAANLGIFPRAADIGRDDPAILQYRSQPVVEPTPVTTDRRSALASAGPVSARETAVHSDSAQSGEVSGRHWVQLAAGRNRQALMSDWNAARERAGSLLQPYSPHVAAWGRLNRLLAGPLRHKQAAQALARALANEGIDSFAFTSEEGQKVERIQ